MDPLVQSTLAGGAVAVLAWGLGAWSADLLARRQREHDLRERRYDDLKSAYVSFCLEMRELVTTAGQSEFDSQGKNYARTDPHGSDPLAHLRAGDPAEKALAELRLFADERLYEAARGWLDAYYVRYWDARREGVTGDVEAAEDRVVAQGQRALRVLT